MPSGTPKPGRGNAGHVRGGVLLVRPSPARSGAIAANTTGCRRPIGRGGQSRREVGRRLAGDLGLATPVRGSARPDCTGGTGGGQGSERVRTCPQRVVRLWCKSRGGTRAGGHADASLLPVALRAVRALFALRHSRGGRRVPAPLHRRRMLRLQRDPLRCQRRECNRRGGRAPSTADQIVGSNGMIAERLIEGTPGGSRSPQPPELAIVATSTHSCCSAERSVASQMAWTLRPCSKSGDHGPSGHVPSNSATWLTKLAPYPTPWPIGHQCAAYGWV